jgi:hypothetical protein
MSLKSAISRRKLKKAASAAKEDLTGVNKIETPMPSVLKTYADDLEYKGSHDYDKSKKQGIEMKTPKGIETQKELDMRLKDISIKKQIMKRKLKKKLGK